MTFPGKTNRALVIAVIASFVVMIGIGLPLLNNAMKGKEKDFNDKLFFVVSIFEEQLLKDSVLMREIYNDSSVISLLQNKFKTKIDPVLRRNGISLNYVLGAGKIPVELATVSEFGKVQRIINSYDLFWSSDPKYSMNLVETRLKVGFLGRPHNRVYFVKIFFPSKQRYLLGLLMPEILAMALTFVTLLTCFLLLLSIIKRQNQLALSRNDFISNMTHELKTPLFTMSIAVKMLGLDNAKTIEKKHTYLATIREEIARLLSLADKVLETSRTDTRMPWELKEESSVHTLLCNAVSRLELSRLEHGTTININLDAINHLVFGNSINLENVFVNIIDNAIKYSNANDEITIQTKNEKKSIIISIADNGIGFDPDLSELVFERFFRAHTGDIHNVKGYGIGLSFARSVIEAHDGRITVNTSPGKGSEFILILPVTNL